MLRNYILKCWDKKVEVHWKYWGLIKNVGKYYVELKCWWSLKCCVSQNCWSSLKMLDIFLTKCWPIEKKNEVPSKCWDSKKCWYSHKMLDNSDKNVGQIYLKCWLKNVT